MGKNRSNKIQKQIKFAGNKLFLLIRDSSEEKPIELGTITTKKGNLTRQQKLKAVAADGDWIQL